MELNPEINLSSYAKFQNELQSSISCVYSGGEWQGMKDFLDSPDLTEYEKQVFRLCLGEIFFDKRLWKFSQREFQDYYYKLHKDTKQSDLIWSVILFVQTELKLHDIESAKKILDRYSNYFFNYESPLFFLKGLIAYQSNNQYLALHFLSLSYSKYEKLNFPKLAGRINLAIARTYTKSGRYVYAERYYNEAIKEMEMAKDWDWFSRTLAYKARHYLSQNNYTEALKDLLTNYKFSCEVLHNPVTNALMLNNIGLAYLGIGKYQMAEVAFNQSIEIAEKYNIYNQIKVKGYNTKDLADLERLKGNFIKALDYANEALKIFIKIKFLRGTIITNNLIAEIYTNDGKINDAVALLNSSLAACKSDTQKIPVLFRLLSIPKNDRIEIEYKQKFEELKNIINKKNLLNFFSALLDVEKKLNSEFLIDEPLKSYFIRNPYIWGDGIMCYTLLEELGKGGFATVYKAVEKQSLNIVALKIFPAIQSSAKLESVINEIKILSTIDSPNIAHIFNYSFTNQEKFIVMEFVDGKTLDQILEEIKLVKFDLSTRLKIIKQIIDGLEILHSKNILHNDLTPRNIIIENNYPNRAVLIDFGISLMLGKEENAGTQRAGAIFRLPPERKNKYCCYPSSDIFMLGCISLELLTGKFPFKQSTDGLNYGLIYNIKPQIQLPEELNGTDFAKIIEQSIEIDHEKRPTLNEIKTELEKIIKSIS